MNDANNRPAVVGQVEPSVRPACWAWRDDDGQTHLSGWNDVRPAHGSVPLYDQAALDAALNLWPRDCRLCANYTTQAGGCVSVVQCVDSMQFKATTPRQYWIAGPND
jgi:hypothetical protein